MNRYPDFLDEFAYADTDSITGKISPTGHLWIPSGACLPAIRSNCLTSSHPAAWSALTAYRGAPYYDNVRGADDNVYYCIANHTNHEPPNETYWTAEGGNYAFVDVLAQPRYQYVDVTWEKSDGAIVLSSSNLDTSLSWMTHFYFSATGINMQMRSWGEGSPTSYGTHNYAAAITLGVEYRIGVHFNGNRFIFDLPDGTQYKWAHRRFSEVVGRYLMFQPIHVLVSKAGCELQGRRLVA